MPAKKKRTIVRLSELRLSRPMINALRFAKTQSTEDVFGFTHASMTGLERRGLVEWKQRKDGTKRGLRITAAGERAYAACMRRAKKERRRLS